MNRFRKTASILLMVALVFMASVTVAAASVTEKKIAIPDVEGGYVTVSNVTSEQQVGNTVVYYATAPVKVTFYGNNIAREIISYLPNGKIEGNEVLEGDAYTDVTFDVANYRYYGDDTVYSEVTQPAVSMPTYVSGNYATLKEPGIYRVLTSAEAIMGVCFYVVVSNDLPTETPDVATTVTATPTASPVFVNGSPVSFNAYNINGNNYFKLRDLAFVLRDTEKKFDVAWDNANSRINLTSARAYTIIGGEMSKGATASVTATLTTAPVYIDGTQANMTAYNINANNYFKLRDVGKVFDFGVRWDDNTSSIIIDTASKYIAE